MVAVTKGTKIYVVGTEEEQRAGKARDLLLLGSMGKGPSRHVFYYLKSEFLDWVGSDIFYPIDEGAGEFLAVRAPKRNSRFIRFGEEGGPGRYDGAIQVETRIISLADLIKDFELGAKEEELRQRISTLSRLIRYGEVKRTIRRIFDREATAVISLFSECLGPELDPDREDIIASAGRAAEWLAIQWWVAKAYLYGSTARLLKGEPGQRRYPRDIDFLVDVTTSRIVPPLGREPRGYDVIRIDTFGYHEPSVLPIAVRIIRVEDMPKEDKQFVLSVCAGPLWTWEEGKFVLARPPSYFGC